MDFQKDYQYHFERMFQDSFMIQYLLQPLILFLIIILIYVFIKKKLLRDEKEDLESLKLLQELLDSGTINDNEFQKFHDTLIDLGHTRENIAADIGEPLLSYRLHQGHTVCPLQKKKALPDIAQSVYASPNPIRDTVTGSKKR